MDDLRSVTLEFGALSVMMRLILMKHKLHASNWEQEMVSFGIGHFDHAPILIV